MIQGLLAWAVWFMTYVYPVTLAARLLRAEDGVAPTPEAIRNAVTSIVVLLLLDVVDAWVLEFVIATRVLLRLAHIGFAVFVLHFGGASMIREMVVDPVLDKHAAAIEDFAAKQMRELDEQGPGKYVTGVVYRAMGQEPPLSPPRAKVE